jgi:3-methyl-2-oxobutanoate hydroxymethyltransferase
LQMPKRVTTAQIREWKGGLPFPMITAYDAPFARICEDAGVELLLVGDSYGMVSLGMQGTTQVELDDMIRASAAVARGTQHAHIVADLPFGSYEQSDEHAVMSALRLVKYGFAGSIKIEGDAATTNRARAIAAAGIPVMGHIGVRPQTAGLSSGYRRQRDRDRLLEDALAFESAGAYAVVLEMVDRDVARTITETVGIPTIGIGSGGGCDGQVLVLHDVLGLYEQPPPFAKRYADVRAICIDAVRGFGEDVRSRRFP